MSDVNTVLEISDDVIAKIARTSACEVEGVAGVTSTSGFIDKISKKVYNKGVHIERTGNSVVLNMSLCVYYDFNIVKIAEEVRSTVSGAILDMTGITCDEINIVVNSIEKAAEGAETK